MPLITFHGKQHVKDGLLKMLRYHARADNFTRGSYGEWRRDNKTGKAFRVGCGVGCTVLSSNHADYTTYYGLPESLAEFEDTMFETMPGDRYKRWPVEIIEAIPVGAVLDMRLIFWALMYTVWAGFGSEIKDAALRGAGGLEPTFSERQYQNISAALAMRAKGKTPRDVPILPHDPFGSNRVRRLLLLIANDSETDMFPAKGLRSEKKNRRDNVIREALMFLIAIVHNNNGAVKLAVYDRVIACFLDQLRSARVDRKNTTDNAAAASYKAAVSFVGKSLATPMGSLPIPPLSSGAAKRRGFISYDEVPSFAQLTVESARQCLPRHAATLKVDARNLPRNSPR